MVNTERANPELLPLSLLNDFLYCPRRAALKIVEGWRSANEHTARGDIVHEHADLPGYEVAKGVTLLRALPIWSERLGLNGKCDLVEVESSSKSEIENRKSEMRSEPPHVGCYGRMAPVEFKLGKRRKWENDDAQLCAQALCLEEMFGLAIPCGAIFHADSKRRREVEFTAELRQRTESAIASLHGLLEPRAAERLRTTGNPQTRAPEPQVPPAEYREACHECSLFDICLPKATGVGSRAAQLAGQLFQT